MSDTVLTTRQFRPNGFSTGLDLDLAAGEVLALTGPSSQVLDRYLRALAGVEESVADRLQLAGIDLCHIDEDRWLRLRRATGLVSRRVPLLSTMNARLNVVLPLAYHHPQPTGDAERQADALLDELGFTGRRDALPAELSSGDCFQLQLARELVLEPRLLFIEEPFSMHAAAGWALLSRQLCDVARRRNIALVVATANIAFIHRHARRTLFVRQPMVELHATAEFIAGRGSAASREFLDAVTTWPREPAA